MPKSTKNPVILRAIRLGARTNSYTVLIPEQSQLLKDIAKDRKKFEKRAKPDKKNCRACKYWNDPGHLATYSYCSRLVLTDLDILTPIDEASYDISHEFLYVPENFSCIFFNQKKQAKKIEPLNQTAAPSEG